MMGQSCNHHNPSGGGTAPVGIGLILLAIPSLIILITLNLFSKRVRVILEKLCEKEVIN